MRPVNSLEPSLLIELERSFKAPPRATVYQSQPCNTCCPKFAVLSRVAPQNIRIVWCASFKTPRPLTRPNEFPSVPLTSLDLRKQNDIVSYYHRGKYQVDPDVYTRDQNGQIRSVVSLIIYPSRSARL